jgi:hypothetical protein
VAAGDEADAVAMLVEAVERGEEAFARDAEDGARALRDQRLDEGVPGGAVRRGRGHGGRQAARTARIRAAAALVSRPSDQGSPDAVIHRLVNYLGMASRSSAVVEIRSRDADRTREEILRAAMAEFAGHGFGGARMGAIAERSGVDKKLIYYYFAGKDELFLAVLEQTYADIRAAERELTSRRAIRSRRSGAWSPSPGATTSPTRSSSPSSTARTCIAPATSSARAGSAR